MKYSFITLSILFYLIVTTFIDAQNIDSSSDSFVIGITGSPRVQRAGWMITTPLSLGSRVKEEDFVELDITARVQILCLDLTIKTLASSGGIGCSVNPGERILKYGGFDMIVQTSRSSNRWLEIPYVISPRASKIAYNQVGLVRWANVIHVENGQQSNIKYSLIMRDVANGRTIANISDLVDTSYTFNDILSSGEYVIEIIAYDDKGRKISSSIDDPEIGLGLAFTVMKTEEQKQLEITVNKILELNLDTAIQAYILSIVYANQGIYTEAINLLESQISNNSSSSHRLLTSPVFYLQLAHYYHSVHLPLEAWNMYNQAVLLAKEVNDTESLAEASEGLIYVVPDYMLSETCEYAASLYSQLGDRDKNEEILSLSKCQ